MFRVSSLLIATMFVAGCGKKADVTGKPKLDGGGSAAPAVAPLAMPILGIDQIKRMSFIYGEGAQAYEKAVVAYRGKPHKGSAVPDDAHNWPVVRANCETAIAKDPFHLDAHRLLATALAQAGEHAAAVDHLVTALAGDYLKYGPSLATDDDLKEFLATPHGQAVTALAAKIGDTMHAKIAAGLLVVGRRAAFALPKQPGVQPAISRGELYAFDRDSRRYLRLSHTDHEVTAFVRAPSGSEVALLGFDKVDQPKPAKGEPPKDPPTLAHAWVQVLDASWKPAGARISLAPAREVAVGYGAGDELLVTTAPASGRWTLGEVTVSSVDRSTGKLTKVTTAPPLPRVVFTLDEGLLVTAPTGVTAKWTGDPPTALVLETAAGAKIAVPESGVASQSSLALAPGGARLVFATAVDPCAKEGGPSLYVADTKSGAFKHLLTAKSRFGTRWLDATTLAYEDNDGAIRIWDAATAHEAMKLENPAGLGLDVLSSTVAPLCKLSAPPPPPLAGSDEPLPEETGSGSASP